MGEPTPHSPALLLMAAFSRHEDALDWARTRAVEHWGPIDAESPRFDFQQTDYYEPTMGADLKKVFFTFQKPFDPAELVEIKLQTNRWEAEYAQAAGHAEPRPLNLDPGYITLGKLVLASTKDFTHRIYMARGIYAEVTLYYKHKQWQAGPWTFADYRRPDYQAFFSRCREVLHDRLREGGACGF
jgi:hypothetical protein